MGEFVYASDRINKLVNASAFWTSSSWHLLSVLFVNSSLSLGVFVCFCSGVNFRFSSICDEVQICEFHQSPRFLDI